jgi:hypothetical protein
MVSIAPKAGHSARLLRGEIRGMLCSVTHRPVKTAVTRVSSSPLLLPKTSVPAAASQKVAEDNQPAWPTTLGKKQSSGT